MKKIIFILILGGLSSFGYSQCCIPMYGGTISCQGGGSRTQGVLHIDNNTDCSVSYSNITSIEIDVSPWIISGTGTPGSSVKVFYGPFTAGTLPGITFKADGCQPDLAGLITYTFDDDCGSIVDEFHLPEPPQPRPTSIDAKSKSVGLSVFPNPASSVIKFEGKNLETYKITLVDAKGVEVIRDARIDKDLQLNEQPAGTYHYRIPDASGIVKAGTLVKQ